MLNNTYMQVNIFYGSINSCRLGLFDLFIELKNVFICKFAYEYH